MAETVAYKYRAFISYSHADTSWAKALAPYADGASVRLPGAMWLISSAPA